jgi:cytochrome c556
VIASAETAVRRGFARAQAMGANAVVALASVGRGEAKRIADAVPELLAVVVGSAKAAGEQNVPASEPERVGNVLIVQAANHLQSVAVLDIYLRSPVESGVLVNLADGTGIELAASRAEIERRRGELRTKIAAWQRDPALRPSDLEARRRDLADLDVQAKRLYAPTESPKGNYYRYANQEIRDTLGSEPAAERELLAYYKAVNEHNRMAFAGRLPVPAGPTDATYVGDEVCATCHADARDVWARTPHATAYATLEKSFKEFNLDCVSCHVTGYELPGGSTVTHVDKLKNVQCEACHGPGSTHVLATPAAIHNVVAAPPPSRCLECHRPPHVENFDPATRMASILGPGHGLPKLK